MSSQVKNHTIALTYHTHAMLPYNTFQKVFGFALLWAVILCLLPTYSIATASSCAYFSSHSKSLLPTAARRLASKLSYKEDGVVPPHLSSVLIISEHKDTIENDGSIASIIPILRGGARGTKNNPNKNLLSHYVMRNVWAGNKQDKDKGKSIKGNTTDALINHEHFSTFVRIGVEAVLGILLIFLGENNGKAVNVQMIASGAICMGILLVEITRFVSKDALKLLSAAAVMTAILLLLIA